MQNHRGHGIVGRRGDNDDQELKELLLGMRQDITDMKQDLTDVKQRVTKMEIHKRT